MGLLTAIRGNRIYLDTNVWIYAVESYPSFIQDLTALLQSIDQGHQVAITSELSLAEVLVKPLREKDQARQDAYKRAIVNRNNVFVVPVLRELLIDAAQVRADIGLKLPDAIHVATAMRSQCTTFLTNDDRLKSLGSLNVVLLSEAISS
ncbi:type II toxin-antitoxin system VapC family toxin [Leptolyngbya sp. AN03gr2]|uniref:type II toxin-antitoxin system VapC family toxin n=1 Tax=unclassified Leptolyngbya TaxID=2650499 RepID=UPI003D310BFF